MLVLRLNPPIPAHAHNRAASVITYANDRKLIRASRFRALELSLAPFDLSSCR